MRKVVVYMLLSLDGVAESPERFFAWDDELDANLGEVIGSQDAVVLGRRSYDEWAAFWPDSDIQPFADFINSVPKYVVTSGALDPSWTNATAVNGDPATFVRDLKEGEGGDIGVHASVSLARSLLAAGVVDELRLVVAPSVVGDGQRLLQDLPARGLDLTGSATSTTGSLMLTYRVAGS